MSLRFPARSGCFLFLVLVAALQAADPVLPGIGGAMSRMIEQQEVAGAVTLVVNRGGVPHLEASGQADPATKRPMAPDTLFWIASMTKPVTAAALLMLQDE
ncbi:MAG: serine hydrolase, partial [Verrucomicrobiota bacterium]